MKFGLKLFLLSALMSLTLQTVYAEDIKVFVDNKPVEFDTPPTIINDRVMVPMRAIFEACGARCMWFENTQTASGAIDNMGIMVSFEIGSNIMEKNTVDVEIDTAPLIMNDRTYLPVRAVGEGLGLKVVWEPERRSVYVSTNSTNTGTFEYQNGAYYVGKLYNGYPNGYGTVWYDSKMEKVVQWGTFAMGALTEGTYYYDDGSYHKGTFKDNLAHGYGELIKPGEYTCTGYFVNGGLDGEYKIYYFNGDFETANFVNNIRDGQTSYLYANGDFDTMEYKSGKLNGKRIKRVAESETYIHMYYENDVPTGDVIITDKDGNIIQILSNVEETVDEMLNNSYYQPKYYTPQSDTTINSRIKFPIYLYSNDRKTFLGKASLNKYDRESFSNEYGDYGSKYSDTSIWNEYSKYGSKYGDESIYNEYAKKPPVILDADYNVIGYLTANKYTKDGVTIYELMDFLDKYE